MFDQPITIGSLKLNNRVLLAPLAGVSDIPFRRICQELGAGLTFVEMLTAKSVLFGNKRTQNARRRHESEPLLGVQITGGTAREVAEAIEVLESENFDLIDINMGCPVRKVVRKQAGSAILCDPERITETVKLARAATAKPLTVKARLGFHPNAVIVKELGERVADAGADMLTIHGRTREDTYEVPVSYRGIKIGLDRAKEGKPDIVTVGNGDITDRTSAGRMGQRTDCDAIMLSRGALGNPWVFREIVDDAASAVTLEAWREGLFRHIAYHEEHYGSDEHAAVVFRKHLLWYVTGFPGIRPLREFLGSFDKFDAIRSEIDAFCAKLPSDQARFEKRLASREGQKEPFDPKWDMDRKLDRGVANDEDA